MATNISKEPSCYPSALEPNLREGSPPSASTPNNAQDNLVTALVMGVLRKYIAVKGTKCSACKAIADTLLGWPNKSEWQIDELKLGTWRGFLNRRHCNCCQSIVKRMIDQPGRDKLKPSCRLELSPGIDTLWITGVSGSFCSSSLPFPSTPHLTLYDN